MSNEERPQNTGKRKPPLNADEARAQILTTLQKAGVKGTPAIAPKADLAKSHTSINQATVALRREGVISIDRRGVKPRYYLTEFAPAPGHTFLDKLRTAAAKGLTALYTASVSAERRAIIDGDAAALESEGVIAVDRSGKNPKYFLKEFAPKPPRLPSLEEVCTHLEEWATSRYPYLLSESELLKRLTKVEQPHFVNALYWLESQRELIRLTHKATGLFVAARALRNAIGSEPEALDRPSLVSESDVSSITIDAEKVRQSYQTLAAQSGFPSVKIDRLQRESGVPLPALQAWLRDEHQQGRAVLSFGDWSLSEESTRAAAIELRGERYLLVKLLS